MKDSSVMQIMIRPFEAKDAEVVSSIIRTTMRISNSADYNLDTLQPLIAYFCPQKVAALAQERYCLVATVDGKTVATAALEDGYLLTFFVLPAYQGSGIGSRLLAALEEHAQSQGIETLVVESSLTGEPFYRARGYLPTGASKEGSAGRQVVMKKRLS